MFPWLCIHAILIRGRRRSARGGCTLPDIHPRRVWGGNGRIASNKKKKGNIGYLSSPVLDNYIGRGNPNHIAHEEEKSM